MPGEHGPSNGTAVWIVCGDSIRQRCDWWAHGGLLSVRISASALLGERAAWRAGSFAKRDLTQFFASVYAEGENLNEAKYFRRKISIQIYRFFEIFQFCSLATAIATNATAEKRTYTTMAVAAANEESDLCSVLVITSLFQLTD